MSLIWKLLKQHVSVPQFLGFALANLFGMCIVLLGFQFYKDVMPVFTAEDSFLKTDYVIVYKKIGAGNAISGRINAFSNSDIDDLEAQEFTTRVGRFTSTEYKVDAHMGVNGVNLLNTELFFESIPDAFVSVPEGAWHYVEGAKEVPVILPRSYIAMYNFGVARSRSLPQISDGLAGIIDFDISIQGNGHQETFKGKVVGFSNRLTTILVPQAFMDWSNGRFAPEVHSETTRIVLQIDNPGAENVARYFERKNYEVEDGQLEVEKSTYFLKMLVTIVMMVGLVISALSFYILMLSIYLLVQKNSSKLENLLLIGYSPAEVAAPYCWITIMLNIVVLLAAWTLLYFIRDYYTDIIETLFREADMGSMAPALVLGMALFAVVSLCNVLIIRRKIRNIWKRKE